MFFNKKTQDNKISSGFTELNDSDLDDVFGGQSTGENNCPWGFSAPCKECAPSCGSSSNWKENYPSNEFDCLVYNVHVSYDRSIEVDITPF